MAGGDEHRRVLLPAPLRAVQAVLQGLHDRLRHKVAHGREAKLVEESMQLLGRGSQLTIIKEALERGALRRLARQLLEQRVELRLACDARARLRVEDRLLKLGLLEAARH
eukprot:3351770-Prymnesium_polylepis.1